MAETKRNPRILIVTPEITYLPEGMGNLAGKMSAKAGGMADVSASLVQALHSLGADVHVALPHYRRMFHVETAQLVAGTRAATATSSSRSRSSARSSTTSSRACSPTSSTATTG